MAAYYTSTTERAIAAAARPQLRKLAAALNVTIEERFAGAWHELILTAPQGRIFAAEGLHEFIIANAGATTDGLWSVALERLAANTIEPCPDGDACEWCSDGSDAAQGDR